MRQVAEASARRGDRCPAAVDVAGNADLASRPMRALTRAVLALHWPVERVS
jgi:hypothetical protein